MPTVLKVQIQHVKRTRNVAIETDFPFRARTPTLSSVFKCHFLKYKQTTKRTH